MNALPIEKIKELHGRAGGVLGSMPLADFARTMQEGDQDNDWSQGQLPDNAVTDISRFIGKSVDSTGLPLVAGAAGELAGGVTDFITGNKEGKYAKVGEQVGRSIPRAAADTGAVIGGVAAAPFTGGASLGLSAAGIADAGIGAYTDTGSVGAGLGSAALTGLAPGIGKLGSAVGTKLLPAALAESGVAKFAAAELGAEGAFFAAGAANDLLQGQNPLSGEAVFANLLGSAAFLPVTLGEGVRAVRRPKALLDSKGPPPVPSVNDELGMIPMGTPETVGKPQTVDANNQTRLFNYLVTGGDQAFGAELQKGNFANALHQSGLEVPFYNDITEAAGKRMKGRELVHKAAEVEDPTVLIAKAAKLLQTTPNNLVDFVAIVKASNEFKKSLEPTPFGGHLENFPDNTPNPAKGKVVQKDFTAERPASALTDDSAHFTNKNGAPYDEPEGLRPAAVKGKTRDLGAELAKPEYSMEPDGTDKDGTYTSKSLSEEFDRLVDLEGSADAAMLRLGMKVQNNLRRQVTQTSSGQQVVPPPLPTGSNFTSELPKPWTVPPALPKDSSIPPQMSMPNQGRQVLSEAFDNQGIHPNLKGAFIDAAENILRNLGLKPETKILPMYDPKISNVLAKHQPSSMSSKGVHIAGLKEPRIGVDTNRRPMMSGKFAAFDRFQTLIHEAIHGVTFKASDDALNGIDNFRNKHLVEARAYAASLSELDRHTLLKEARVALVGDQHFAEFQSNYASKTSEEFLVDYTSMVAIAAHNDPAKAIKWVQHLPEPLQNLVRTVFRTTHELIRMVTAGAQSAGWDEGRIQELNKFNANVMELVKPDPVVKRAEQKVVGAAKAVETLQGDPGQTQVQFNKTVPAMDERQKTIAQAGTIQRNVGLHQQMAASPMYRNLIPAYQNAISILTKLPGAVQNLQHGMRLDKMLRVDGGFLRELASISDKKLTPEQRLKKSNFNRVGKSPELTKATSDLMRETNILVAEAARDATPFPTWDSPRLQSIWSKLSPDDQAAVKLVYDADLDGNKQAAGIQVAARQKEILYDLAGIYKTFGNSHADSEKFGRVILNSVMQGQAPPSELLTIAGTDKALKHWENVSNAFAEFEQSMARPYFNEQRTGRFFVSYEAGVVGTEVVTGSRSADSKQERDAILKDLQSKGHKILEVSDRKNKEYNEFDAVPTYLLERAANLEKARYDSFLKDLGDSQMAAELKAGYSGGEAILEQIANRKGSQNERQFKPGREMINMINAQDAYVEIIANSAAKQMARADFRWQMKHEDWDQSPRLKNEVDEFGHNVLAQGGQKFQTFRKAVIGTAMGANISSAFIDATQPITMGLHRLIEQTSPANALRFIRDGYIEAFRPTIKDKEFEQVLIKADTKGLLTTGSRLEDFVSSDDLASYNIARAGGQRDLVDLAGALSSKEFMAGKVFDFIKGFGNKTFNVSMLPMSFSAQVNNKTMLYAGYRLGKEKGLKGDALYDFAENMMQVSNIQGARAAQSSFKLKAGKWNEAVSAASILTNYPIAAFSQMYGSYKSALKSSGLSADQRHKAMQAFGSQVLTQFAFAGTLGFGLDALFTLVKEGFGIDPEEEIRQGLSSIDESGLLADVMMHGVANQMTGVDIAGRYSLSGVAGFNGYTGFDAKGLFGAAGSFWTNLGALPGDITEGRSADQWGILPSGFKKMLTSIKGEPIKDKNGQVLMDPSETERMTYFMGFRPKKLADIQEQRSAMRSAEELTTREKGRTTRQRIEMLEQGNYEGVMNSVKEEMLEYSGELQGLGIDSISAQKQLDQRARSTVLQLVQQAVDKGTPIDPMNEGSAASASRRSEVAKSFGNLQVPRAVQMQREAKVAQHLTGLGQSQVKRSPRAVQVMQAVDMLMMQQPQLTRQEATAIVNAQIP